MEDIIGELERDLAINQDILDSHTVCPREYHTGVIAGLSKALSLLRRYKHTLSPSLQQKGYDEPTQNSETGSGYILPSNASPVVMGKCLKCEEPTYANYHLCHTKTSDD